MGPSVTNKNKIYSMRACLSLISLVGAHVNGVDPDGGRSFIHSHIVSFIPVETEKGKHCCSNCIAASRCGSLGQRQWELESFYQYNQCCQLQTATTLEITQVHGTL